MIYPGLVSITFRNLSPEEIVALVAKARLKGIEWGGDVHVPHGDVAVAERVKKLTEDAGLTVAAYGSYYRAGEANEATWQQVLDSAAALGAPTIRAWAGKQSPADTSEDYRKAVIDEAKAMADAAAHAGMTLSFEYHRKTLTETDQSARDFFEAVHHAAVRAYWQPSVDWTVEERLESLRGVEHLLSNLHVYHWQPGTERRPVSEGAADWARYFEIARGTGRTHYALIEFVKDNTEEAFLADADALRAMTD